MTESPCIGICVLDDEGCCTACGRTGEQIARWSQMSTEERRAIMAELGESESSTAESDAGSSG